VVDKYGAAHDYGVVERQVMDGTGQRFGGHSVERSAMTGRLSIGSQLPSGKVEIEALPYADCEKAC
jgi:hypothetical protein